MKLNLIRQLLVLTLLFLPISFFTSCVNNSISIEGKWERYDDTADGSIVSVAKTNEGIYEGKLIFVSGELTGLGFKTEDLKWKALSPQSSHYYNGQDLKKGVDSSGRVAVTEYDDIYLELVSDDIMVITSQAENDINGSRQKWRRIIEN